MKTSMHSKHRAPLTAEQMARRRSYLGATLVTCIVLSLVGGTIHILELGSNRMLDMRNRANIDLTKEETYYRAAGEETFRQTIHEYGPEDIKTYTVESATALLTPELWAEVNSMISIPAGSFTMGTNNPKSDDYNGPEHEVTTKAYKIDKYPITNAQYALFVAETGYRPPLKWDNGQIPPGKVLHPVIMISWANATAYAKWAGKRLPTEMEWEKAARGTDARRWPWGNRMEPARLNTYYNIGSTTDVTQFPQGASPYGVMDMAGNVSEWTVDNFEPYQGSKAASEVFNVKVAQIPQSASDRGKKMVEFASVKNEQYKVMRGGSWKGDPFSTSAYHRGFAWPQMASDFFGFRCVSDDVE